jgi:hypothetical protein
VAGVDRDQGYSHPRHDKEHQRQRRIPLLLPQPHSDALPLCTKQRLGLIIKIPGRLPLLVHVVVVWSEILSSDEDDTLIGVNLRFLELFYRDREFLHKTLQQTGRTYPVNSTLPGEHGR